jgi:hypothetical protein
LKFETSPSNISSADNKFSNSNKRKVPINNRELQRLIQLAINRQKKVDRKMTQKFQQTRVLNNHAKMKKYWEELSSFFNKRRAVKTDAPSVEYIKRNSLSFLDDLKADIYTKKKEYIEKLEMEKNPYEVMPLSAWMQNLRKFNNENKVNSKMWYLRRIIYIELKIAPATLI